MEQAELSDSWLNWCRDRGVFVACAEELVTALANALRNSPPLILEVGAGSAQLAHELQRQNVAITPADPMSTNTSVIPLDARKALSIYRPATVFSSFLPVDAGIEKEILQCPSVQRYLYIGPKIMGRTGPESLWRSSGWEAREVPEIDRCLISRLDVLPDFSRRTHQRGAGAILLQRIQ
jgi:hypothetical protein